MGHMHKSLDHLPAREDHDDGQRKLREIGQRVRVERKEGHHTPDDEDGKLRIGAGQAIGGALGQPVQIRHAAEEARPHIGDPDGQQTVVAVAFPLERVDFFNGGVAHHLFDDVNHGQHHCKSHHGESGQGTIEVRDRQRKPEIRVFHGQHRHRDELGEDGARRDDDKVGNGRVASS